MKKKTTSKTPESNPGEKAPGNNPANEGSEKAITPDSNGKEKSVKKAGKAGKSRKPKKRHQKKGGGSQAPPSTIRFTDAGFSALLVIETENPEMTRTQILSDALLLLAGNIAHLPPIQLSRLDKETLIILAGVAAKRGKTYKEIFRKIILAELDDEEKAKHVAALEMEIQKLRDDRLTLCRMAGMPISHDLTSNIVIAIGELMNLKKEKSQKSYQNAFDDAIQILSAFMPIKPDASPKPIRHSESPPPEENPVNPSEKNH